MLYPNWLPSPENWDAELRHLSGQHDQDSHGGNGGTAVLDKFDTKAIELKLLDGERVTIDPEHVDSVMSEIQDAPSFNLNKMRISGPGNSNLFDKHARDIPRREMPQIPRTHGQLFQDALAERGISTSVEDIDPRTLRATQNELDGPKVAGIYGRAKAGELRKGTVLYATKSGDVLDGHHRWAAVAALNAAGQPTKMTVVKVDTDIDTLLNIANTVSAEKLDSGQDRRAQPTKPMPTTGGPWVWINGEWVEMITDTGDGIPESLDLPEGDADPKASKRHATHNQKDHGRKGLAGKAKSILDSEQWEALRPQRYSRENYLNARMLLEETPEGRDLYSIVDRHAASFAGAGNVSQNTWTVAKGKSTGNAKDDREAKALIEASRSTPPDMIPKKLYRGLYIDDLEDLGAKPGDEVELPSSAFSASRNMARTFSDGKTPVLIEFDTSDGAQALPIQNLTSDQGQHSLEEFVAMGRFVVDSIEEDVSKRGLYVMKIRQTGMF